MTVSIIIAVKTWQENLARCVKEAQGLDFADFEILVLPDAEGTVPVDALHLSPKGTVPLKIVPTGPVSPGEKRDIALKYAKGEILAFIDDDAYPRKDWLKNAVKNFEDPEVAAVGGPAITPEDDSWLQKSSGLVYSSAMTSGPYTYRYIPAAKRLVEDYPSCNLLVRKSVFEELGGFNTSFWPGEDTKLCLDITQKLKKKIVYDPEAVIYHHRRPLFIPHLKQIASYALHRGYFVKHFPQTSLKLSYFLPSLLVIFFVFGTLLSACLPNLQTPYFYLLFLYLFLTLISSIYNGLTAATLPRKTSPKLSLISACFLGIILTHIVYGLYFMKGLISLRLKEEN